MDLIERYAQASKIDVVLGQKCKVFYEKDGQDHYKSGIVVGVYDSHFEIQTEVAHRLVSFNDTQQMSEVQLLTINGLPAMAKKNIFGKYKLTR